MKDFYIQIKNGLLDPRHVKAMGGDRNIAAVWLFMWFLDKMTIINHETGEGKVLGGRPIKYEDIQKDLGISRTTYWRWTELLKNGGYISTSRTPAGLSVIVYKAFKVFGQKTSSIISEKKIVSQRQLSSTTESDVSSVKHPITRDVLAVKHPNVRRETSNIYSTRTVQLKLINTGSTNTVPVDLTVKELIISPKGDTEKPVSYGNEDINYLTSFLKEKTGLIQLDGSQTNNRRYCWLAIKKFGTKQKVEMLIKMALASDFHRKNLTGFKYLYNNGVRIASDLKYSLDNPSFVKIN